MFTKENFTGAARMTELARFSRMECSKCEKFCGFEG
jgi:hypothetical protein